MIESQILQKTLGFLATHSQTQKWDLFHEKVRSFYFGPGKRGLQWLLKPHELSAVDCQVLLRHSVSQTGSFNAFMSDLDLSVVLADDKSAAAEMVVSRYMKWRCRLPMLGELEIYSQADFLRISELLERHKNVYGFIRLIRKLAWMEEARAAAKSKYHQVKAERSIAKILAQAGIDDSSDYRRWFSLFIMDRLNAVVSPKLIAQSQLLLEKTPGFKFKSQYLASTIECVPKPTQSEPCLLELPSHFAVLLIALTPVVHFENPQLEKVIIDLRRVSEIKSAWAGVSEIESLVFHAVLKAQAKTSAADRDWLNGFQLSWRASEAP